MTEKPEWWDAFIEYEKREREQALKDQAAFKAGLKKALKKVKEDYNE